MNKFITVEQFRKEVETGRASPSLLEQIADQGVSVSVRPDPRDIEIEQLKLKVGTLQEELLRMKMAVAPQMSQNLQGDRYAQIFDVRQMGWTSAERRQHKMLPIVAADGSVTYVEARPDLVTPPARRRKPTGGLFDPVIEVAATWERMKADGTLDHMKADVIARVNATPAQLVFSPHAFAFTMDGFAPEVWEEAPEVDFSAPRGALDEPKTEPPALNPGSVDE